MSRVVGEEFVTEYDSIGQRSDDHVECQLKICARIDFTVPRGSTQWERITRQKLEILHEIDSEVEQLLQKKTFLFESFAEIAPLIQDDAVSDVPRGIRIRIDPDFGLSFEDRATNVALQ